MLVKLLRAREIGYVQADVANRKVVVMSPGRMTLPNVRSLVDCLAQSLDAERRTGV